MPRFPLALLAVAALALGGCLAHAEDPPERDELVLSRFDRVADSDVLRATLGPKPERSRSDSNIGSSARGGYSETAAAPANALFLDATDGTSRWLFSDNAQSIVHDAVLASADSGRVLALLFETVSADTDGDDDVDGSDARDVVLTDARGDNATTVIEGRTRDLGRFRTGPTTEVFLFQAGGTVRAVSVDLTTREATPIPLAEVPKGAPPA